MDLLVESVLQASAEKEAKYKTTDVVKDVELEFDERNLLAVDPNPLDLKKLRSDTDAYLQGLARDNTQLLINNIWKLPVEQVDGVIVCKLPDSKKTILPREKPVPKAKPPTKWDKYAKIKGITKTKRSRMIWDEQSQSYKPRFGYQRANDNTKDWLIEVPQTSDPFEDQYEKRQTAKKERTAKNELHRLRNIARNMKGKVPGVGLTPLEKPDKNHLSEALHLAKRSNASHGKFTGDLPKEKTSAVGRKRKFESNTGDFSKEKKRSMKVLDQLYSKKQAIDATQAANQMLHQKEVRRSDENKKAGKKDITHKGKGRPQGRGKGKPQANRKPPGKGKGNSSGGKKRKGQK